jgi:large subunit ribosomal protein L23
MNLYDVIAYPLITEKCALDTEKKNKYAFRVHPSATKVEIKQAVEKVFNVKVVKINTSNVRGKLKRVRYQPGYTAAWKKAVVTLKGGQKIDFAQ